MKKAIGLFFLLTLPAVLFCGQFTVTAPVGGEKWLLGSEHNITWTFSNVPGTTSVKVMLFRNGTKVGNIAENIPVGTNGAGTYAWHAGDYIGGTAEVGDGYEVRIRDMNNNFPVAKSPQPFSITMRIQHLVAEKVKLPAKPHPIHSAGTVTVRFNRYCDLDAGYEVTVVPGCDFWWSQNSVSPYQRVLIPCAGSKFKKLGVWSQYTYESLRSASGYSENPIMEADLPLNMVVGYLTDQMRSGAMRIVGKGGDGSLTVAWVTYEN